ncbi:uncharacterized protein LOC126366301 [Pectinophora gossypiella]|uniref:C2H2-type domain-containing protein n=1 Tax=Pectinophora gossypiella TaxID=13191 RepID=A0A1E1WUT6_PECGO|nr:uncharacterized protein LOC126366301 [Pectinophora gossypiella]
MNFRGGYTFEDNSVDDVPNPFEDFSDSGHRNQQYNNAYGDYQGGYGPPTRSNKSKIFQGPGPQRNKRTPAIWGRGFGPNGPPFTSSTRTYEERAVKYLVRCGLPMNSVKNLPADLLELLQPHYCGLCGQNFESFQMSRSHYISRRHAKNKSKWLGQHHGKPPQGFNEAFQAPFRSRDMYCELCDVQITSKIHADSHYSGKSHRSVVDGRKKPKNVNLLKPGMERRIINLIRREKKFLKMSAQEAPVEVKEPAKIQSDLFCEICKTSVTCTEQMTSHLNGKRHLQKEKQYILKAMQGGNPAQTESNDAENQVEDNGDAEQDEGNDDVAEEAENGSKGEKEADDAENEEWGDEWD